jgi:hypothetical protein
MGLEAFHPGFRAIHPNCMAFGLQVSHPTVVAPSLPDWTINIVEVTVYV